MCEITRIDVDRWDASFPAPLRQRAIDAVEAGGVILLPHLRFAVEDHEHDLLTPAISGNGKNIAFDAATGVLHGHHASAADSVRLRALLARFVAQANALVGNLLPPYRPERSRARTSFRPVEIEGRVSSWRKDDTRLHVDAFPSSPTRGARILRVFTNIDPHGHPRVWRLGEPFDAVIEHHRSALRGPVPGVAPVLERLKITKGRRSAYDHLMLRLHDRMKADRGYQSSTPQQVCEFPAGATWIVFTDQVAHAAIKGQHALEQTYVVPLECMHDRSRAPLARLERILERELV
jgi:hypothetical protein